METLKINYDVHLNFYMRIHDAEMFGGKGSTGYLSQCIEHCQEFDSAKTESAAKEAVSYASKAFEVSPDKIELITYQKYMNETDEEENMDYENACSDE